MRQAGLFGLTDQQKRLSNCGNPLETMGRVVDFEIFRPALQQALAYGDGAKGGRPPYDPMAMFKVLTLAAQNTVSDTSMEFLIRDRLSWLRFLGLDLGAVTPDENTIRLFRKKLIRTDALFAAFDRQLRVPWLSADGRTDRRRYLVAAPKQRNNTAEKRAIKAGKSAAEIWPDHPSKAAQKDTDARDGEVRQACPELVEGPRPLLGGRPGSTSRSSASATKAPRSAGATASSDRPRSPTVPVSTVGCCATSSLATTPPPILGGHRLPQSSQRSVAEVDGPGQPRPSQEAQAMALTSCVPATCSTDRNPINFTCSSFRNHLPSAATKKAGGLGCLKVQ